MQANDLIQHQLEQTVTCLRDRLVQAEERLHTQVVRAGGRLHHQQAHRQLLLAAKRIYFILIQSLHVVG